MPIVSLWLFGGDTLKDFAFALLVGIGAGAYSSIFIAAPLLAMFKEREPEYARRREDEAAVDVSVGGALLEAPVAATAAPAPAPAAPVEAPVAASSSAARERRQQRRSGRRPHGRAR